MRKRTPMTEQYEIAAVISTYNRCELLCAALDSLLAQSSHEVRYEVIVVDNNSNDQTREVVEGYRARGHQNLTYIFEPRQGVSYARNTGIAHARARLIAFVDDDVRVSDKWIATIKRKFDSHPEIDCIGGKVLPQFRTPVPRWLTRDQWMPLGLQDYGDEPLSINAENPLCLVSANLVVRRTVFDQTGPFALHLQRVKDSIGSIEDAELLERFWRSGRHCMYVPDLTVTTEVPSERMTKSYHRRWHTGHGYFFAIRRSEEMERSSGRLFDVPGHLYRQAFADGVAWLKWFLLGKHDLAFAHEMRIRFFLGFFRERRKDYLAAAHRGPLGEIIEFVRSIASKKSAAISREIG